MGTPRKRTARISSRGQISLPKQMRETHRWTAGTDLVLEERPDGILLRRESPFPPTDPRDVFGSLGSNGPAKSIDEMNDGVLAEARRRYAGD